ncbi:MAG TPA: FxsA family protein, partial [Hyphomicrobiales bacterium]|nr:FxsA family protein [Hyphomicrobiales bacterium]
MLLILLALFILGPIAEIYVLLAAGSAFGVLPVIAACLITAFLGGFIIRLQGMAAIAAARRDLDQGRPPVSSAVDGALLV